MTPEINQTIENFVQSSRDTLKIIVIFGPTGSGKTALSLEVAELTKSEILSVDARQIYRGLDIGTGKILPHEMRGIPHHLLDILSPLESTSVVEYESHASLIIQELHARGSIPVLCGGTGLYIDSLIYERGYPWDRPDPERRRELEEHARAHGNQALWQLLHAIDPSYAETLHVNNTHYIIRGIEVFEKTGRSKSEAHHGQKLKYETLFLTPYTDSPEARLELYARIDRRVRKMFSDWLIDEVCYNIDTLIWGDLQLATSCPWLNTIWYREVVAHLRGELTLEETIALVAQHHRNYAKRQITWNKKYVIS